MKKLLLVLIVSIVILNSCGNMPGQVYLAYSWLWNVPKYVYDTNTSLPSTIYNNQYYEVDPGSYYIEYISSFNDSYWYMYYTLEAETDGKGVFGTNPATYYIIVFNDNGIYLQNNGNEKSLENNFETIKEIKIQNKKYDNTKREILVGSDILYQNGYKLTIEYGKLE